MQHAHGLFLVVGGAGFDNRADDDLQQSAADRIDDHRTEDPGKRVLHHLRQDGQQDQSGRRKRVREHHGRAVSDSVHKTHREQVHQQLDPEVEGHQQGNPVQRELIAPLKGQKQERHKVVDDGLYDVRHKAGGHRFLIAVFHLLVLTRF